MAQVTTPQTERDAFEWLCEYVAGSWGQLPALAAEWHDWGVESRMDFLTDWPVTESYTDKLFAMEPSLSSNDARAAKVRALRALVKRNRLILEELEARIHEQ